MDKPISTKMHGVLDYFTAPTLLVLPRTLGWDNKVTNLLTGAGLGMLGYSMMTRYELGIFKVLPMKWHLRLDMISGMGLAVSPFVLLKNKERTGAITGALIGFDAFEIAASLLTKTRPPLRFSIPTLLRQANRVRKLVMSVM